MRLKSRQRHSKPGRRFWVTADGTELNIRVAAELCGLAGELNIYVLQPRKALSLAYSKIHGYAEST